MGVSFSGTVQIFSSTLNEVMEGFGCAIYEDELYTINGDGISSEYSTYLSDPFSWSTSAISYPTFPSNTITRILTRYQQQFVLQNIVYIIKPSVGVSSLDYRTLLVYDLSTHQYLNTSSYESTSNVYQRGSCVTYNSKLNIFYSIGGSNTTGTVPMDVVEIYNLTSEKWMNGTSLLEPRYAPGCAMDQNADNIYVFGGLWTSNARDTILQFNVSANNSWSLLSSPTLGTAAYALKCILFIDGNIYCVGGYSGSAILSNISIFDPSEGTMDNLNYLNTARYYFGLLSYKNCIYVAGGVTTGNSDLDSIEYLCIENNSISISTIDPSNIPTAFPTSNPSYAPSIIPTIQPSIIPTIQPSIIDLTDAPSLMPISTTLLPTNEPSILPTIYPLFNLSSSPSLYPSFNPTGVPTTAQPTIDSGGNYTVDTSAVLLILILSFSMLVIIIVVFLGVWYMRKKQKRRSRFTDAVICQDILTGQTSDGKIVNTEMQTAGNIIVTQRD